MRIALVTPAPRGSRSGNRHTALRWAAFLRAAGHHVDVSNEWHETPADLLLALHARRSHASIRAFRDAHAARPLVLALTGTDVYADIHRDRDAQESLRLADRFIVLQPGAIDELPRHLRGKAAVVVQSCSSALRQRPVKREFRICVVGHLRAEKDPLLAGLALTCIPADANVKVVQLGASLDDALAGAAQALALRDPRYRWLGSVAHARALRWLASSHAMVISSRMEGGANVVSEAIRIGVPVLASRISGNIGLLGVHYPGYFDLGNARELAECMLRIATDRKAYNLLRKHIAALRPMVDPRNEARQLLAAVESVRTVTAR